MIWKYACWSMQVMIFLMVLYITQTFRHERILEMARRVAAADLEQARYASA